MNSVAANLPAATDFEFAASSSPWRFGENRMLLLVHAVICCDGAQGFTNANDEDYISGEEATSSME